MFRLLPTPLARKGIFFLAFRFVLKLTSHEPTILRENREIFLIFEKYGKIFFGIGDRDEYRERQRQRYRDIVTQIERERERGRDKDIER